MDTTPKISQTEFDKMYADFQKSFEQFKKGGKLKLKTKTRKNKKNKSKH